MSTLVPVVVKWGKQTIQLEIEDMPQLVAALEQETGLARERTKLLAKTKDLWKGVYKDQAVDLQAAYAKHKQALQVMCLGSATALDKPATQTVFIEDLPPEQIAKVLEPAGLVNLGNTCYLNSVVQALRVIEPLREGLVQTTDGLGVALRETLTKLDRQTTALEPHLLLRVCQTLFPQLAQRGSHGEPLQQDAEEVYSHVLQRLSQTSTNNATDDHANFIDHLFGLELQETLVCTESAQEPPVVSTDWHRKLVCNIQGGTGSTVNVTNIYEGIKLALTGTMEKDSRLLGRNATWTRTQVISKLPMYLTVQFGRFYWKATPDSQDHAGVKCKVVKGVAFGDTLDVYEFCSPALQAVLKKYKKAAEEEKERLEQERLDKLKAKADDKQNDTAAVSTTEPTTDTNGTTADATKDVEMKEATTEDDPDLAQALAMSLQDSVSLPIPEFQAIYELFAVVTHKGRDADGGHYMAWVKSDGDNWYVFDDDQVSPCTTEDVLKLKGGGDWHMSYLNFYRAKQ
jgi:ubiquitin carboxyl-terminal hydrolase 14